MNNTPYRLAEPGALCHECLSAWDRRRPAAVTITDKYGSPFDYCTEHAPSNPEPDNTYRPDIVDIVNDPAASNWLKKAAREALNRDPVDVANDAEVLLRFAERRAEEALDG